MTPTTQPAPSPATTQVDPLPAVADDVRQDITQYAFVMFHLQRVNLLQDRGVQQSLSLSPAQIERFAGWQQDVKNLTNELTTLSPAEMETRLKSELLPKAESYRDLLDLEFHVEQHATLRREVLKRQRGAITFLLPGVPEELELTQEQKDAIYRTVDETRRMLEGKNLNNPLEIYRLKSRGEAARKDAEEQLTPDQRERWTTMVGAN